MAGSVNKVILIGNLGKDPEIRTFQNGGKVCNFSIATSENWKDRNTGEKQERTQWHNIAIFSEPISNVAEQYLKKGSKIYVEGELQTNEWERGGQRHFTTQIVAREMQMLDSKNGAAPEASKPSYPQGKTPKIITPIKQNG